MRVIKKRTLVEHWEKLPDAKSELQSWYAEAKAADWATPADVKDKYRSASILKDGRVVFNICGNRYRLIVRINYDYQMVYIRFFGTHKQYDKVNAETI